MIFRFQMITDETNQSQSKLERFEKLVPLFFAAHIFFFFRNEIIFLCAFSYASNRSLRLSNDLENKIHHLIKKNYRILWIACIGIVNLYIYLSEHHFFTYFVEIWWQKQRTINTKLDKMSLHYIINFPFPIRFIRSEKLVKYIPYAEVITSFLCFHIIELAAVLKLLNEQRF